MNGMKAPIEAAAFWDTTRPHIVLDWETLALCPQAKILSLGTAEVWFGREGITGQEWLIDTKETFESVERESTVAWWNQPAQAKALKHWVEGSKHQLDDALFAFCQQLKLPEYARGYYLWGNGADFDLAILWKLLEDYDMQLPAWDYRRARCFRTLKCMYPQVAMPAFDGIAHTAMADAMNEAQHLQAIYNCVVREDGRA